MFPADAKPSIFPFARYSNPFAMEEFGFDLKAFVGCSPISITSVQLIISKLFALILYCFNSERISDSLPNKTILVSLGSSFRARIAP